MQGISMGWKETKQPDIELLKCREPQFPEIQENFKALWFVAWYFLVLNGQLFSDVTKLLSQMSYLDTAFECYQEMEVWNTLNININ